MIFLELKFPQSLTGKNLENAAYSVLEQSGKQDDDLTLVLTGDEELRRLNLEYTGNDSTTDVLSFTANETDPETGRCYLGDVIISLPRASEQAEAGGHTMDTELQLLVVHGVLHLLGYNHIENDEKTIMWTVQNRILEKLGLEIEVPDT